MESLVCLDAWNILQKDPSTILVDVRTEIEWQNLGWPNITTNQLLLNSIRLYPEMELNNNFAKILLEKTQEKSCVFFLCRYGSRSLEATLIHNKQSASPAYNLIDGFEGNKYGLGWVKSGLPLKKFN